MTQSLAHDGAAARGLPTVSIVLPVRNEGSNIQDCLVSVFGQDYPGEILEVVAVDGGSTDGTPGKLEHTAQEEAR